MNTLNSINSDSNSTAVCLPQINGEEGKYSEVSNTKKYNKICTILLAKLHAIVFANCVCQVLPAIPSINIGSLNEPAHEFRSLIIQADEGNNMEPSTRS